MLPTRQISQAAPSMRVFEPLHRISLTAGICPFPPSARVIHCHAGLALRTAFQSPHLAHPPASMFLGQTAAIGISAGGQGPCRERLSLTPGSPKGSCSPNTDEQDLSLPTHADERRQMKERWWPVPGAPSKHTEAESPTRTEPHSPSSA